ncbi:carbonic anhydrase 14 isoform X1 [Anguilla anguilla]|uniref:carbonic anhydrase 14 isoform X1 n=1 Tax=Anguilla anguilla TaxID=7936 RepID=UPI0015ACDB5E|nr:carbonic anhydrase 14 isoform X1 [Anguilla anguilla]
MGKDHIMDSFGIEIIFLILFGQWTNCACAVTYWTYTGSVGQSQWSEYFPDCGGTRQSPIDVKTSHARHDPSLPPARPLGYRQLGEEPFTLTNNGHTVEVSLPGWMGLGGLPWQYTAVQLHLHWGSRGGIGGGSEHTIDGHSTAAELHVVHYNSELYSNVSTAMRQRDGLAVLGVLIETGEDTNPAFENIINYLENIKHAGQRAPIPAFDVQSLLPLNLGRYFRYNGSLTTPPCFQSVLWTVFADRVAVSHVQLRKLETALFSGPAEESDSLPLQDNYRHPQPLNRRLVLASFPPDTVTTYSVGEVCAIVIGTLCGCVGLAAIIHFVIKTIRSTSSWDVLPSVRPPSLPRSKETAKEPKQDVVFKTTSDPEKEEAAPQPDP